MDVYWFDDTGRGQCRVPESWDLLSDYAVAVGGENELKTLIDEGGEEALANALAQYFENSEIDRQ